MLTKELLFKKGDNHDYMLLWRLVVEKVNPNTNVSVANLKDELKNVTLDAFGRDIKVFNTWFMNKRNVIIREVGMQGYTKHESCQLKTYPKVENKEFLIEINQERRD
eukprot:1955072-Ditylum_brightwellii.AAC.1